LLRAMPNLSRSFCPVFDAGTPKKIKCFCTNH
jgi:hypothetical protein